MNRFRTRKKAKDGADVHEDTASTAVPPTASKSFRWAKKAQPEPQPVIDLATALPPSDDFRTSLLMPNLSARFSMLREQDDPSSKIGKANDDSVLFPKRASRLNLFANNPLTDIDEVASLKTSIRPPFAQNGRTHSFDSDYGYGTDDDSVAGGSMISRSKPGQGNNLFGGRQKLYQIPMDGSSKNVSSPDSPARGSGFGGKVVYENDISMRKFQRMKQEERFDYEDITNEPVEHDDSEPTNSPLSPFSKNRGTSSSTTSGPTNKRTSTAATSVDSLPSTQTTIKSSSQPQPIDRQTTMHKRLYGQALDQTTSARDMFENFNRHRAASNERGPLTLLQSKSVGNMHDRFQRNIPLYASQNFRTASPPPSTSPPSIPTDLGKRSLDTENRSVDQHFGFVPPLSPPISDSEGASTFSSSLQPGDRGKATAMGLFNKPNQQYDEQQFSQRQVQMHGSGSSGTLATRPPPPTTALPSVPTQMNSRDSSPASSNTFTFQRASIDHGRQSPKAIAAREKPQLQSDMDSFAEPENSRATFLDNFNPSDESESENLPTQIASSQKPNEKDIHPAFRAVTRKALPAYKEASISQPSGTADLTPNVDRDRNVMNPADSPTLGPTGGIGGLVRTHLRQDSERSTLPPNSPRLPLDNADVSEIRPGSSSLPARSWNQAESMHSDPWEYDDTFTVPDAGRESVYSDRSKTVTMSEKARQILGQATALRDQRQTKAQQLLGAEAPRMSEESPRGRHARNESADSQDEFSNQLAERRRRVQENLKSVVEVDSRSGSPLPIQTTESRSVRAGNAFAKLRPRPSKQQILSREAESSSKAMKMLGIGSATMSGTPTKSPSPEELWQQHDETSQHGPRRPEPRPPRSPIPPQTYHYPNPPRLSSDTERPNAMSDERARSATPASSKSSRRHRSSSDISGQNKSRNGKYRDDLDRAMEEGSRGLVHDAYTNGSSSASIPRTSNDTFESQNSGNDFATTSRYRPNSRSMRPAASNYFEAQDALSVQTNDMTSIGLSPRPSPITPYSANSTPPLYMDQSPGLTPTDSQAFPASASTSSLQMQAPRKRSVSKHMISEPTFLSSTSTVNTIGLQPPTTSLRYGGAMTSPNSIVGSANESSTPRDISPPLPIMNPRRRRATQTQTLLVSSGGRQTPMDQMPMPRSANNLDLPLQSPGMLLTPGSARSPYSTKSEFSDDGAERKRPRQRQKLRKSSSEGGSLASRARADRMRAERSPGLPIQGGYQGKHSPAMYYSRSGTPTGMMSNPSGYMRSGRPMGSQSPSGLPVSPAMIAAPFRPSPAGAMMSPGPGRGPIPPRAPSRQKTQTIDGGMF